VANERKESEVSGRRRFDHRVFVASFPGNGRGRERTMSEFGFDKWEGLGNDFVVVQATSEEGWNPARVARICDRRFGIGADGVLLVLPPRHGGAARMKVLNADGSTPEMCGNGARCVARMLAERDGLGDGELTLETDAGPKRCKLEAAGDHVDVEVDMGVVKLGGKRQLTVEGSHIELYVADVGNPHAVLYREDPERDLALLGPVLAVHPMFDEGTNVELVRWNDGVLEVAVWERGVGRTLACGTGACAVAAVACHRGEVASGRAVRVRLPGGDLTIRHDASTGRTTMTGPARRVFRGTWSAS
jgi:diaminopimelate epimerase